MATVRRAGVGKKSYTYTYHNMSTFSESENPSTCANCGKGEDNSIKLKACTACKLVKYCNRSCQIAHRPQHKKECKKRAAELHDEKLFKQPLPLEDCPICMIRLPSPQSESVYMACCGKMICCGCFHAFQLRITKRKEDVCPFCRAPPPGSDGERIRQFEKRANLNDPIAIYNLGGFYSQGLNGLPQSRAKALELWHRAAELGSANAYFGIGNAYKFGRAVEVDEKKAKHYWELAAIHGDLQARFNLGVAEGLGNVDRALKHWMIAARDGHPNSLKNIQQIYSNGHITKDDYAKAQQSYKAYVDEIKSDQRDEAAEYYRSTGG